MTDRPNNPRPGDDDPRLARATLLRCAADEELDADQLRAARALVARHPEDKARVLFERELRKRVASAMSSESIVAPPDLRADVRRIFAGGAPATPFAASDAARRPVWRIAAGWGGAIAAVVAIAALFFAFRPAPTAPPASPPNANGWSFDDQYARAAIVSFVEDQHDKCAAFKDYFRAKMVVTDPGRATASVRSMLGRAPETLSLAGLGYEIAGLGPCTVPGPGRSVHVIYRAAGAAGDAHPPISLFIQDAGGLTRVAPGDRLVIASAVPGHGPLLVWQADGLVYYLVCPGAATMPDAAAALGAPDKQVRL